MEPSRPGPLLSGISIAAFIAGLHLLAHLLTHGNYGIFRDELYYLDCARNLDWGYVDHPPLSIALLALGRALLGESLQAIRLLSGIAGAAVIVVAALIAKEMGGGRRAQVVAALTAGVAPGAMVLTGFFSMNAFDLLFWSALALVLARIVVRDAPRLWLVFGLVAGAGLMNKISVLFLGFGVAVAIVLTPLRRHLARWQLWAGGALAGLLFLPYVLWNVAHDGPTLEFMANARQYKIAVMSPVDFFGEQVLAMSPALAPLWLGGLIWLLVPRWGGRFRALGIAFLAVSILLVAMKVKPYYLFPAFTMLFAAGGCAVESLLRRWNRRWPAVVVFVWIGLAGALTIPLAIPLLSPEGLLKYQATLGLGPKHYETSAIGAMPQYYADRFGWENLAAVVAGVYDALPEQDKRRAAIFGGNYGEAGAINYYGQQYGLPPAISGHNNHWLWGPRGSDLSVLVVVGARREQLEELFEQVELAAVVRADYVMPYENDLPVFVCRRPKVSPDEAWREAKKFI